MPQCIVVVLIAVSVCAAAGDLNGQSTTTSTLGIEVSPEGVLLKDGQPFRAVGVNCFDCFYNNLIDSSDTSYMQAFEVLKCHNVQFVRFSLSGFYPIHFQLYFQNKPEFYRRLDAMVQSAEQNGIGLMPSFFWTKFCISDIFGEHINKWGDTNSQTRQFMRSFTTEVVLRYKNSPAIWGWEFGNEDSLNCNLPNAADWRPEINTALGTPSFRTAEDDLTADILHSAVADFAQTIRAVDPNRVISSGSAFMRSSQWHQYTYNSWDADTPAQTKAMIDYLNPDPIDIISVHAYYDGETPPSWDTALAFSAEHHKPLFAGEFGVPGSDSGVQAKAANIMQTITTSTNIPLSAAWVYHALNDSSLGAGDPTTYNLSPLAGRLWQLDAITQANFDAQHTTEFFSGASRFDFLWGGIFSNYYRDNFTGLVGGTFTANPDTPVIDQMGFYDKDEDGLAHSHVVGLYHKVGSYYQLVAKATIPAGTAAPLRNGFRWVSITPYVLSDSAAGAYLLLAQVAASQGDKWGDNIPGWETTIGTPVSRMYRSSRTISSIGSTITVYDGGAYGYCAASISAFKHYPSNVQDLAVFAENWLSGAGSVADIWPTATGDGKVDLADFSVLAKYWMN